MHKKITSVRLNILLFTFYLHTLFIIHFSINLLLVTLKTPLLHFITVTHKLICYTLYSYDKAVEEKIQKGQMLFRREVKLVCSGNSQIDGTTECNSLKLP